MRDDDQSDDKILSVLRLKSQRMMQTTFAWLAIFAVAAGLAVHYYAPDLGLADEQPAAIANCFLVMAVCYAATIFVWEWLFETKAE